jgi:hypothetical protein
MIFERSVFIRAIYLLLIGFLLLHPAGPAYSGAYQVSTGADYFDPNYHFIENIIDNSDTSSTINFTDTSNIVFASSVLAAGEIKVAALSNQGAGRAGWMDEIELTVPGLDDASMVTINIRLTIDGAYTAPDGQAAFAFHALSGLYTQVNVDFLQTGATYDTNHSAGTFHTYSPDLYKTNNESGDWLYRGPRIFIGQIDIAGSDPTLRLDLDLTSVSGPADFSNTASIWLELPEGSTIISASQVFLSQASPPLCNGDREPDEDVDGSDLGAFISDPANITLVDFAKDFGRENCLINPP